MERRGKRITKRRKGRGGRGTHVGIDGEEREALTEGGPGSDGPLETSLLKDRNEIALKRRRRRRSIRGSRKRRKRRRRREK